MQIAEEALTEFIKLYKEEFKEDIDRDHAQIIARNLILFYLELEQGGIFQAASKLEEEASSDDPVDG